MLMNALILDVAWYQIIQKYTLNPNENNKYTATAVIIIRHQRQHYNI